MSIEDKWADRVFRAPKSGSDYTSSRVQTQRRDSDRDTHKTLAREMHRVSDQETHKSLARATIESDLLERQKLEIADMQLVINQLVQRLDQLEDSALDDQPAYIESRVKRLEIFVVVLSSALIIAVIMKALNVMGINVLSMLTNI